MTPKIFDAIYLDSSGSCAYDVAWEKLSEALLAMHIDTAYEALGLKVPSVPSLPDGTFTLQQPWRPHSPTERRPSR